MNKYSNLFLENYVLHFTVNINKIKFIINIIPYQDLDKLLELQY